MKSPFGDAHGKHHDSDCRSLYSKRGGVYNPERHNRVAKVFEKRRSAKIVEDNPACEPGIKVYQQVE